MSTVNSVSHVSTAYAEHAKKNPPPAAPPQHQGKDTVELSKTAQAALSGADVDHDGDSH
jgi:hypothetical protein